MKDFLLENPTMFYSLNIVNKETELSEELEVRVMKDARVEMDIVT